MRAVSRQLLLGTLGVVVTGCGSQQLVTQLWPWKQDPPRLASDLSRPFPRLPAASSGRVSSRTTVNFDFDRREVELYVDRFQSDLRGFYGRALERSGRYVPFMEQILKREGIPPELVYLPLIESGFQTGAVSPAGAVGPWQFMRHTGRRYGLRIDGYVDERRDPVKSTEAAARYLRDLYDMFNDWHLSLAAYNTGEGNILRILERRGATDYWEMRRRGDIVPETREYVPRFLAALQIARSPETYGFPRPESEPLSFDWVRVNRPLSLDKVAQLCGSSKDTIRELNPALTRGVIPHNGYTVRLPKGMKRTFMAAVAKLPASPEHYASRAPSRAKCSGMQADGTYCLRTGETVAAVAQRYGVSPPALLKANGIRDARRLAVGQALVIPGYKRKARAAAAAGPEGERVAPATHRVRPGETLAAIAARHGMTAAALARANGIDDLNRIKVGQVLQVPPRRTSPAVPAKVTAFGGRRRGERHPSAMADAMVPGVADPPRRAAGAAHRVQAGETPATIAKRYGVPLDDLLRANGLRDPRRLQVGRAIVVPQPGRGIEGKTSNPPTTTATHVVRSGDTLYSIARRHRVSIDALRSFNGMKPGVTIHPGQKLRIPKRVASK